MRTYVNVRDGQVVEVLATDRDITEMFHPDLVWIDVTDEKARPTVGWLMVDGAFTPES